MKTLLREQRDRILKQFKQYETQQLSLFNPNDANRACDRIEAGLQALNDATGLEAFRIANRAIEIACRRQLSQDRGAASDSFDLKHQGRSPHQTQFARGLLKRRWEGLAIPTVVA